MFSVYFPKTARQQYLNSLEKIMLKGDSVVKKIQAKLVPEVLCTPMQLFIKKA